MSQVHDDSRQETGFRRTYQKTHEIKLPGRVDEGHQHRHQSPGNHDASDPLACAPSFHNERAWDFQQKIPEEENPRSKANYTIAEHKGMGHLQRRGANVHSIEKANDVAQEEKRHHSPRDEMTDT